MYLNILQTALETMSPALLNQKQFYLRKGDVDWQNIILGSEAKVTSHIDCDGVETASSISGFASMPLWLRKDWNLAMYDYTANGIDIIDRSPEELRRYRKHYSDAFALLMADDETYDPRMTSLSHVVSAINAAIADAVSRPKTARKLLLEAGVGFTLRAYAGDFYAGDTEIKNQRLREAFAGAWRRGCDTALDTGFLCEGDVVQTSPSEVHEPDGAWNANDAWNPISEGDVAVSYLSDNASGHDEQESLARGC